MREDKELNDSQVRKQNQIRKRAIRNQEKRAQTAIETQARKENVFRIESSFENETNTDTKKDFFELLNDKRRNILAERQRKQAERDALRDLENITGRYEPELPEETGLNTPAETNVSGTYGYENPADTAVNVPAGDQTYVEPVQESSDTYYEPSFEIKERMESSSEPSNDGYINIDPITETVQEPPVTPETDYVPPTETVEPTVQDEVIDLTEEEPAEKKSWFSWFKKEKKEEPEETETPVQDGYVELTEEQPEEKKKSWFSRFRKEKKEEPAEETVETGNIEIPVTNEYIEITAEQPEEKKKKPLFAGFKKDNGDKPEKIKKEKEPRPKAKKVTVAFAILMCLFLFACLCAAGAVFAFAYKLVEDKPTLNVEDLVAPDSTTVYDSDGNKIMELGMYLRENIPYEEMPNHLIDAFLSIEDSRFFEHVGFDIPRFTAAALANLRTRDFSQGGSTVTMQLIKNTYYSIDADADSTIAAREGMSGIKRKMQEIVLALELELKTDVPKQDIIAMYINKVNYGDNIRGVQKAAQYYFGKDAENLSLTESAFLAGLINSPNTYNPYNDLYKEDNYYLDPDSEYLQAGTARRDEVLDLMVYHGYITEQEAALAKSVRIEDLLVGRDVSFSGMNEKYQSYIDAVIDEVEEVTGESPYNVGMEIYTNMNAYMQEYVYDLQNEEEYTTIKFPNELCQSAIVVMNNQNGAIEALGGGRGETEQARQFNRATSAYLNPGSSIKPVIDYALCIEKLGYATSHTFTDMPYYLYDGNVLISNYDHTYYGDMLMTEALGRSQNTPAVQALAAVVDEIGDEAVIDYLNSIGFKFDYTDFDLQFAIGGNRCLVTPLQLAGAHAMFINGGHYIKPHTVNYIVYNDGRENFVADTKGEQLLSPETAWMVAYLEQYNMTGQYSSLMWYCKKYLDYPLYGKTGTTDWGDSGKDFGIPTGSTKDSWLVMQTNKYTISCWTGYDNLEKGAYFSSAEYQENTKSQIVTRVLEQLEEHHLGEYDPYEPLEMPDTVVEITHVKGAYPYAYGSGESGTVKGYISAKVLEEHPLVPVSEAYKYASEHKKYVASGIANLSGSYNGNKVFVSFGTGAGESGTCVGESCDLSTTNLYGETTYAAGRIWFPHWTTIYTGSADPPYLYTIKLDSGEVIEGSTDNTTFNHSAPGSEKVQVCVKTTTSESQACITIANDGSAPVDDDDDD
ncbi:MAG: transglycosylase domain-containing protein [Erysipelotrichaceae bacterium]|nr:transglycosylase domain-containing protein [Erysipelotrichaceae bacterium]